MSSESLKLSRFTADYFKVHSFFILCPIRYCVAFNGNCSLGIIHGDDLIYPADEGGDLKCKNNIFKLHRMILTFT